MIKFGQESFQYIYLNCLLHSVIVLQKGGIHPAEVKTDISGSISRACRKISTGKFAPI